MLQPSIRTHWFTGIFFLSAQILCAANSNPDWLARWWQSDDGLPDNNISGVAQTPDGYLWVGTAGGLRLFDGVRFQAIPLLNLDGVPNHVVRAMTLDRRGRVWLDMDRGPVVCIEPGASFVFTNLPDVRATTLADDDLGSIWIAYADGEVARIGSNGQSSILTATDGLTTNGVCWLATGRNGQLWFAKDHSVGIYQNGRLLTLTNFSDTVGCIARRRGGGIWGCSGGNIFQFDEKNAATGFLKLPADVQSDAVTAILEDRSGALWIGTTTAGLFRYHGERMEAMPSSHREITCLTEDFEGNIWAGTAGGGLNRVRPRIIELVGTESGLPFESIRSVCEDPSGAIWAVTEDGSLACRRDGVWTNISRQINWPGVHAACVAADNQGRIWMGTRDAGLWCLENDQWRGWHQRDGLGSEIVRGLLISSADEVWLTTDQPGKVQKLRENHFENFELPSQTRSLRAIVEDAAGDIWVGSADGQLFRVHGNEVIRETPPAQRLLSIRCLYAAPDGAVWIGYAGWGLGCFKGGHYTRITSEQGLYDDYVSQLAADNRGWLWCAGNRGVFQVRLDDLRNVIAGGADRVRSIVHGRDEGLPGLQPNYENPPGAMRARDGRVWFPMRTGLAVVNVKNIPYNSLPPPVIIERVRADGKTIAVCDSGSPLRADGEGEALANLSTTNVTLHLGPAHHTVDFEFTALSFTAPENVRLQYRLENYDDNWTETTLQRSHSYSRLPPGRYRFEVRACNNDGVWTPMAASLSLVVAPFYWQTWWFRVIALLLFTSGVIAIARYVSFRRLRRQVEILEQQAALQRERARIAKDIHDDLGANLTQIAFLGELARQDGAEPDKAAGRVEQISTTARQAVKALDEIVWAVNPRNDTLAHLIDYAGQFALDYLRVAGIRCRLDLPDQHPPHELSTDLRHNLFLAIKEALHNIVKHAHASEVWLRIHSSESALDISVEDNGQGFDRRPDDALADGLRNMKQRMSDIGGEFSVESRAGAGTKIQLHLPWTKSDK